jgi:hypothetical protein
MLANNELIQLITEKQKDNSVTSFKNLVSLTKALITLYYQTNSNMATIQMVAGSLHLMK